MMERALPFRRTPFPEMQQRERLAGAVEFGTSFDFKAEPVVERDRIRILLVDVDGGRAQLDHGVLREPAAEPQAKTRWMHEQRFQFSVRDAEKCHERAAQIAHTQHVLEGKQLPQYEWPKKLDIGISEEVMGRAHRSFPDLEDAIALLGPDPMHAILEGHVSRRRACRLACRSAACRTPHSSTGATASGS